MLIIRVALVLPAALACLGMQTKDQNSDLTPTPLYEGANAPTCRRPSIAVDNSGTPSHGGVEDQVDEDDEDEDANSRARNPFSRIWRQIKKVAVGAKNAFVKGKNKLFCKKFNLASIETRHPGPQESYFTYTYESDGSRRRESYSSSAGCAFLVCPAAFFGDAKIHSDDKCDNMIRVSKYEFFSKKPRLKHLLKKNFKKAHTIVSYRSWVFNLEVRENPTLTYFHRGNILPGTTPTLIVEPGPPLNLTFYRGPFGGRLSTIGSALLNSTNLPFSVDIAQRKPLDVVLGPLHAFSIDTQNPILEVSTAEKIANAAKNGEDAWCAMWDEEQQSAANMSDTEMSNDEQAAE